MFCTIKIYKINCLYYFMICKVSHFVLSSVDELNCSMILQARKLATSLNNQ